MKLYCLFILIIFFGYLDEKVISKYLLVELDQGIQAGKIFTNLNDSVLQLKAFLHLVLKTWYFYQFVIMVVSDLSEIGSVDTDCEGRLCGDICEYTQRLWNNTEQKNGLCNEEGRCHGAMVQCGMNTFSCYFLVIFHHI